MLDEKNKNGQVSDAELDALLAKWAEEEIEPPSGFHEQTMNRLRAEQILQAQPKKKNNIITLFAKQKRWTSIAAAAVLMLFCMPVVQGQFGSDVTESMPQQMQMTRSTEGMTEHDSTADNSQGSGVLNKEAVMNAVSIPETGNTGAGNDNIAVAQMPAEGENTAAVAAFSLDDEEGAAVNSNARMRPEQQSTVSYALDESKTVEELEQELEALQENLAQYEAQLAENPDDANLQEIVTEQQKAVAELQTIIEEMKQ